MAVRRLTPGTIRSLTETGRHGRRVVEMLEAAAERLEGDGAKTAEIVCYCAREAFNSLLQLSDDDTPSIKKAAKEVLAAATQDPETASGGPLRRALDALEQAIDADKGRNERRLSAAITGRAGMEPVRFQTDLFFKASRLISELNTGLHNSSSMMAAEQGYEEALGIIEALFAPITGRLDRVDELASRTEISSADIESLEALSADPPVAQYFFTHIKGKNWFSALRDHELLRPRSSSAAWPASAYLIDLAESDADLVVTWLEERLKDPTCTAAQATIYIFACERIGFAARKAVLAAVHRHKQPSVAQEAATYVASLDGSAAGDRTVLRITEAALRVLTNG
jgi:hypothetical protein